MIGRKLFCAGLMICLCDLPALAASIGVGSFDPSQFANPTLLLDPSIANPFIRTLGILADHRAYQPATALGTAFGLDIGIEATLMKIPQEFNDAIASAGYNGQGLPVAPIAKLHLHKGIGPRVDIGGSGLFYQSFSVWGIDLKVVTFKPEEGLTWAVRMNYGHSDVGIATTRTYTPQLLLSTDLEIADPYFGFGYEYVEGTINIVQPTGAPAGFPQTVTVTGKGSGGAFMAFLGVALKIPATGIKLTVEGAYSLLGADTLGTKFGFAF